MPMHLHVAFSSFDVKLYMQDDRDADDAIRKLDGYQGWVRACHPYGT